MKKPTVRPALEAYLAARPQENAFLCAEFIRALAPLSYSAIARALAALVREGVLVKLGYGVYARAEKSEWTGAFVPAAGIDESVKEALIKMGVSLRADSATRAYNEYRSTQVPAWLAFDVGPSRITRKIGFRKRMVTYERSRRRAD